MEKLPQNHLPTPRTLSSDGSCDRLRHLMHLHMLITVGGNCSFPKQKKEGDTPAIILSKSLCNIVLCCNNKGEVYMEPFAVFLKLSNFKICGLKTQNSQPASVGEFWE